MCRGIIWYDYIGDPQWNHTYWYQNYAFLTGVFYSIPIAFLLYLLEMCLRRFNAPKLMSAILYLITFSTGWVWIVFEISSGYILEFGNTWSDAEIIREIVFVNPLFIILMIAISVVVTRLILRWFNR